MAPLNVPRAHRLPTGYVIRPVEEGVMDAACTLALHLTQAGLIPRRAPRPGETPESYILNSYVETWRVELSPPDVRLDVTLLCGYSQHNTATVGMEVLPQSGRVLDLRALRADLRARDRYLFGALMFALRAALAPYQPVFTGQDAVQGEEALRFGEMWWDDHLEALSEAEHEERTREPRARDLCRWLQRQGAPTPYDLGRTYPMDTWTAPDDVARSLQARLHAHRVVPGLTEAADLLAHLATLPFEWRTTRAWAEDGLHPGVIDVVICQDAPERDPVLEFHRDVTDLLGMPHTESPVESLAMLEVHDWASHEAALRYLRAVADVQARTRAMWDALTRGATS
ncbi:MULTISPECIES: hypothetical protein [unclassified Deinococcus]|nr:MULTISPECIES: hypothetical protein [unclassified Deinococcus]NTX99214.1 hypothetical protein [Deinococcus sp. JMULE3]